MSEQTDKKFREWTAELDGRYAIISIFEHIRDIPFSLSVPMIDQKTAPDQMLLLGKGYCGPKHYILAEMCRRHGYEAVYAMFPFMWNDPDLHYPPELRHLATSLPVAHHLACRVRIEDSWVLVDAPWDPSLAIGGFPVNEHWGRQTDTVCAVKPLQSPCHMEFCRKMTNEPYSDRCDPELNRCLGVQGDGDYGDHARHYRRKTGMRTPEEVERNRMFYQAFELWLHEVRKHR